MNIFEKLGGKKTVFKDKKYLDHRFLPNRLPHREEQIKAVAKYWIEALNRVTPPDITIYGKTGTGKTAVAKFAMKQLEQVSKEKNINIKVEYIRGTDYTTEYQVLTRLCQQMGHNVPYRGWTKPEVIRAFKNLLKHGLILIVVLDEIDVLLKNDGGGILYTLTRTDNISITSISNYVNFKKLIGPRVKSSLCDREMVFPPYDAQQLIDILKQRAKLSFKEEALNDDVIPLCAALSAKEEGDARYALDLLRTSGEIANDRGSEKVTADHVREAKDYIEHSKITDVVMTLPSQQQRVLESILHLTKRKEEITSGRLYDVYKDVSKGDIVSYRRIFDFINELEMLGIISTNIISRGRGKGRTSIINLQCETSLLEDALWNG